MAILCIMTLPPEVTLEQVLAVSAEVGAGGPPVGGISHAVIVEGGQVKIFDVWASKEAMEAFTRDRLAPAIAKSMGVPDAAQLPQPDIEIFEAHDAMGAP